MAEQIIFDLGPQSKVCTDCKRIKNLSEFGKKHGKPRYNCKECHSAETRKYNREQSRKHKDYYYWQTMKRLYGLSPDKWQQIYNSQNGLCALCKKPGRGGMRSNRLNVDHCHSTGRVRGFLCINCNTSLGVLGDTPEKMAEVIKYLQGCVHMGRPQKPKKPRKKVPVVVKPWGIPPVPANFKSE